jgi:hypothetical protein
LLISLQIQNHVASLGESDSTSYKTEIAGPTQNPSEIKFAFSWWHVLPAFDVLVVDAEPACLWFLLTDKTDISL